MNDRVKIIIGLVVFIGLITIPVWYRLANPSAAAEPEFEIVTGEKNCVEPVPYMKASHADLLNEWRQSVVREGNRTYVSSYGKEYGISLTGTCLGCHSNQAEFCDKCHDYSGVKPGCWDCHIVPEGD